MFASWLLGLIIIVISWHLLIFFTKNGLLTSIMIHYWRSLLVIIITINISLHSFISFINLMIRHSLLINISIIYSFSLIIMISTFSIDIRIALSLLIIRIDRSHFNIVIIIVVIVGNKIIIVVVWCFCWSFKFIHSYIVLVFVSLSILWYEIIVFIIIVLIFIFNHSLLLTDSNTEVDTTTKLLQSQPTQIVTFMCIIFYLLLAKEHIIIT